MYAQELQGTLLVTLRNSNQIIDDGEVRRKFQQFGDVKSIRPAAERHELVILLLGLNSKLTQFLSSQRHVEFYDTRVSSVLCNRRKAYLIVGQSAEEAYDRLRHQGLQDGVMDIVLAWEETPGPAIR